MKPLLVALCLLAIPAHAQPMACDDRAKVLDHLESKYDEKPTALGMATNGSLVEVVRTESGSTWTIVITNPNGTTCLMAAGSHWENLPEVVWGGET